jgi:electron transfer flavoprotein alpha subunit
MSVVLALIEQEVGTATKPSLEAVTVARRLAIAAGDDLEAVVTAPLAEDARAALQTYGVEAVHVLQHPRLAAYAPAAWSAAVTAQVAASDARVVIAPGSDRGGEVMAHLAARLGLPLAASCVEVAPDDGAWRLTRLRWGGVLLEDAALEAARALITVAPHHVTAEPAERPGPAAVHTTVPELDEVRDDDRVRERVREEAGVSLATAPVVVAGGRGVGSAEAFAPLEELATLLGGAVGCSRVATNNGWRSHNDQVGQTGTRVAPELYIACGISGATQHWVGCMGAKRILAINTDPEAPMVTRAHYAVLGDLHALLPALLTEVRRRRGLAA